MSHLEPLGSRLNVVVFGATGGIGRAFVEALQADPAVENVLACSRSVFHAVDEKVDVASVSFGDEDSIIAAAQWRQDEPLDLVIVATGLLHSDQMRPEKSWQELDADNLFETFKVNTIGPALIAKHFLPRLRKDGPSVFAALSARVGSISDNQLGGWHGYRVSKAALNMLIKSFAIELARRNRMGVCIGLHPGTVDTPLSLPFQRGVAPDKLFTPARAAQQLLDVIAERTPEDSGDIFAWDGTRVPA